jgi:serine/threonine protein kinase
MPAGAQEEFLKEATVMQNLQHWYVVQLYGVCIEGTKMIVQELVPLGALQSFVENNQSMVRQSLLPVLCCIFVFGRVCSHMRG